MNRTWTRTWARTWPAFLLVLAIGCGGGKPEQDGAASGKATGEFIRGFYTFGHEVRELVPCGQEEPLWVLDGTRRLGELYGGLVGAAGGDDSIFVAVYGSFGPALEEGFGDSYPGTVTVDEVIYAAREGIRCDFDFSAFRYRAQGNEPFWMVTVDLDGMRLKRPGFPDVAWPDVVTGRAADRVTLTGVGGAAEGKLVLVPGPAFDSMSGAYFHLEAEFEMSGKTYSGAALKGLADPGS